MSNRIEQRKSERAALNRRTDARQLDVSGFAARGDFDPASSDLGFPTSFDDPAPSLP
jgi:hypothetical protein